MILPITVYGDPVLRNGTKDVEKDFSGLKELISNMYETMYKAEGIGLAGPQVNVPLRLFVVDLTPLEDEDPIFKDFKKAFINPYIVEADGEDVTMQEGCLSVPGINEDVTRKDRIRVKYFDENWNEYDEVYEGMAARCIQHEYDHVIGKFFVDYCSPLKKRLIKGKLMNIAKGKVRPKYPVKPVSR